MHHDGVEAADLEHDDVAGKHARQFRVHHGVAAVFHHDDLVVIALQEGQRLREDAGRFVDGEFIRARSRKQRKPSRLIGILRRWKEDFNRVLLFEASTTISSPCGEGSRVGSLHATRQAVFQFWQTTAHPFIPGPPHKGREVADGASIPIRRPVRRFRRAGLRSPDACRRTSRTAGAGRGALLDEGQGRGSVTSASSAGLILSALVRIASVGDGAVSSSMSNISRSSAWTPCRASISTKNAGEPDAPEGIKRIIIKKCFSSINTLSLFPYFVNLIPKKMQFNYFFCITFV